jgi:hypothetical protein
MFIVPVRAAIIDAGEENARRSGLDGYVDRLETAVTAARADGTDRTPHHSLLALTVCDIGDIHVTDGRTNLVRRLVTWCELYTRERAGVRVKAPETTVRAVQHVRVGNQTKREIHANNPASPAYVRDDVRTTRTPRDHRDRFARPIR